MEGFAAFMEAVIFFMEAVGVIVGDVEASV